MMRIEAQPFPFTLKPKAAALVLIDMQRDFVEPGGFGHSLGNDVLPLQAIISPLQHVLQGWRSMGGLVVHTRESHRPDLSDCPPAKRSRGNPALRIGDQGPMGRVLIQGEPGNAIIAELQPLAAEIVIDKPGKGAFYATTLHEQLTALGIEQLIFTGVTTEVCVQTSMREANDRGYECLLLEDCTASYFADFKQQTIAMLLAQGGIVGWCTSSLALLSAIGQGQA